MRYDWLLFFLFISGLIYTLVVIKGEKKSFNENAVKKEFSNFIFLVPSWWGEVENTNTTLRYQRLDTRYEWEAKFSLLSFTEEQSIEDQFKEKITALKILFDTDSSIIMNPSDFKNHIHVLSRRFSIVRIEGTATQDETERRYLDAFLLRDHQTKKALFATSLSSVLNGLVEGPYFEEVLLNFDIIE
jgi:hypothetical protein